MLGMVQIKPIIYRTVGIAVHINATLCAFVSYSLQTFTEDLVCHPWQLFLTLRASPPATRRPVAEDLAETAGTGAGIAAGAGARTRAMAGGRAGATAKPKPGSESSAIGTAVLR